MPHSKLAIDTMANYTITLDETEIAVAKDSVKALDMIHHNGSNFHVLHNNKAYQIEFLAANYSDKTLTLTVNGNRYSMKINDEYDQTVKLMGLLSNSKQKAKDIKAPMPGLIVDVLVKEGQQIAEGTPLIILSAMKMENIIAAKASGVIKAIQVKKDQAVEKGQIIIEIE